jgi:hypothetical protein
MKAIGNIKKCGNKKCKNIKTDFQGFLTISDFHKNCKTSDKLTVYCKECDNIAKRKYRLHNKRKISKSGKKYYRENKDKIKEKDRIFVLSQGGKLYTRKRLIMHRFGKTLEWFDLKLKEQDNKCSICRLENTDFGRYGPKNFAIDHDSGCCDKEKTCGKCTRGLLCDSCNLFLGSVEKKNIPDLFSKAQREYLAKYGKIV